MGSVVMNAKQIPEEFIKWAFVERRELIKRMMERKATKEDFLVGFTRHTPAIITHGPGGLNASIKGVGFVLKEKYLDEVIEHLKEAMKQKRNMMISSRILMNEIYTDDYMERIDFTKFMTLELAMKHTWQNLNDNSDATLLFYTPPETTYEVRCVAEVHTEGKYWEYANLIHDVFHMFGPVENPDEKKRHPAYIFNIKEIWDNHPDKMGVRIY